MRTSRGTAALGLVAGLLLAGCGAGATPAAKTPAAPAAASQPAKPAPAPKPAPAATAKPAPLQKVTLRLDWLVNGYDAPFVLARAKGYYRQAGLDVSILQGKGSAVTAETVGNGSDTFGVADAGTAAISISKGVPVKYLADYIQQTPLSFIYHKSETFNGPTDLKGKTVIASAGDADLILLPAVLAKYHMSEKALHIQVVQVAAKIPAFLKDKRAVLLGFATGDYLRALKEDPNAQDKTYSAFGVNPYSIGLITGTAEIRNHPGTVRRFLAATTKGWTYAAKHPAQAVSDTLKAFPRADGSLLTKGLALTLKALHTPATRGRVVGWMAKSDWQATIALLHRYAGLGHPKALSAYYTDGFLPKS